MLDRRTRDTSPATLRAVQCRGLDEVCLRQRLKGREGKWIRDSDKPCLNLEPKSGARNRRFILCLGGLRGLGMRFFLNPSGLAPGHLTTGRKTMFR